MKKLRFNKTSKGDKKSEKKNPESGPRRSSDLQTSYLLPRPVTSQPQKSDSFKKLHIEPIPNAKFIVEHKKKIYKVYIPERRHRDFHEAAEFYHRSEGLPMPIGSIEALRRTFSRQDSIVRPSKSSKSKSVKRFSYYPKRCRQCLHLKQDCVCESFKIDDDFEKVSQESDWMTITLSHGDPRERFDPNSRLKWLEELEEESEINKQDSEKNLSNFEFCCFPFSTVRMFSKKKSKEIDFYTK